MANSLYIDASAIIAIINNEAEAADFINKMELSTSLYSSAISKYEALAGLCVARKPKDKPISASAAQQVRDIVEAFFTENAIAVLPIGAAEAQTALGAYQKYGKGTGAKANLNMGDCFSYACSRTHNLPLLFKGNDFIHTDIVAA